MIVWLLTRHGVYFLVANLVGIAVAVVVNYTFSVAWVWRREA
jgi:putative flippase GtrA